jgi:predicted nucleic acid-binding protein
MAKGDVCTNEAAIAVYRQFRADDRIGFVVEEASGIEDLWLKLASLPECAPKRWMDAYLAALAISHGLPFASLDGGFERYRSQGLELHLLK